MHPRPTNDDAGLTFAACVLTYAPCIYLDLALVVPPFKQLAQVFHLHTWWLSPVTNCASGAFHSATSIDSPFAHMVTLPSTTCAGGAF